DSAPYEIAHPRLAGLATAPISAGPDRSEVAAGEVIVAASGAASGGAGTTSARDDSDPAVSEVAPASPQAGGGAAPDKPAETGQTAEPPRVEPTPAQKIDEALHHPGPISLFVSRKLGKLFVRKGFAPVFDVPVTIARPEVPLGTHVFTASRPP